MASTLPLPLQPSPSLTHGGRDRELVSYVGRHGIVAIGHVMAALGVGQASAYRRVSTCIDRGLLERLDLLRREPSLIRATRAGLRYAGLGMPPAVVSPGAVDHWLRCATTAQLLAEEFGAERVVTERELALAERHESHPIASAKIGELPDGRPRLHRPDLVVVPAGHPLFSLRGDGPSSVECSDGSRPAAHARTREPAGLPTGQVSGSGSQGPSSPRTQGGGRASALDVRERDPRTEDTGMRSVPAGLIAIEVELTPKSPKRLRQIIRGWRRASWVDEVRYNCEPGQTRRAVERAVEKLHAGDRIAISEAVPR
jgi:hypothetical protein